MSQLILIKDKTQCPACARRGTIRMDQRHCNACNTRIFKPEDNFRLIAADAINSFWVYFPIKSPGTFRGWVHSSHLGAPNPNESPLDLTKPSEKYGREGARAEAAAPLLNQ